MTIPIRRSSRPSQRVRHCRREQHRFQIFPPRTLVMQDTFRPPWFHRNVASDHGPVHGAYDAKAEGFVPGGASLHNSMTGHGPMPRPSRRSADLRSPTSSRTRWRSCSRRARSGGRRARRSTQPSCRTTISAAGRPPETLIGRGAEARELGANTGVFAERKSPTLALLLSGARGNCVQHRLALRLIRAGCAQLDFLTQCSGCCPGSFGGQSPQPWFRHQQGLSVST